MYKADVDNNDLDFYKLSFHNKSAICHLHSRRYKQETTLHIRIW